MVTSRANLSCKGLMSRPWDRKLKNRFLRILSSSKCIDLHQTNTKMISGPFYTYLRIHFTSKNASFFWYLSACLSVAHLTYLSFTVYWSVVESVTIAGRINCCTHPSVRLSISSVHLMPLIFSKDMNLGKSY